MKYMIIVIVLFVIILFLLIYPFKLRVSNESNYLYVNIANFLTLKVNLLLLLDKAKKEGILNKDRGLKIIKKLSFKNIDINIKGLNFDYTLNGAYYGGICAISGFYKKYLESKNIEFNYNLEYMGDKSIEFQSIIKARAIAIVKALNSI